MRALAPLVVGAAYAASACHSTLYRLPVDAVLEQAELTAIEEVYADDPLAYRRDVLVAPTGQVEPEPELERAKELLPATCAIWIERCPALRDEVARLFEVGATYRGASSTGARGCFFWCAPQGVRYDRGVVDPLDTLAVFLVLGAEAAENGTEATGALREGSVPEHRAHRHAARILRVVELLQAEAECLSLGLLPDLYGATLQDWSAAVERAGGDVDRLAAELLATGELTVGG